MDKTTAEATKNFLEICRSVWSPCFSLSTWTTWINRPLWFGGIYRSRISSIFHFKNTKKSSSNYGQWDYLCRQMLAKVLPIIWFKTVRISGWLPCVIHSGLSGSNSLLLDLCAFQASISAAVRSSPRRGVRGVGGRERGGRSAGSFSLIAAGNRAYVGTWCMWTFPASVLMFVFFNTKEFNTGKMSWLKTNFSQRGLKKIMSI